MSDPVNRFSSRAQSYAKHRPGYPPEVIGVLQSNCGLTSESVIADVGSGTGILTEIFLKNGNHVFAVEPNGAMRSIAEQSLSGFSKFVSVDGSAESTGLEADSVDLIAAAQAFHWFDHERSKKEFARILRPNGWVVLLWNERKLDSKPFLREYEQMLVRYGTDYQEVRHENAASRIADFFSPEPFKLSNLDNFQYFDFEGLKGRVSSASYTPEPGHPDFEPMMAELERLFNAHEDNGTVTIEYITRVYYGRLRK